LIGRRQVLDLPQVRAEVIEHQVRERHCRGCGWVGRGVMPDLRDQVAPHRRVSWRIMALVATLRTKLRLPLASLQWLLAHGWGVRLSVGELSALLTETARAGQTAYEALLAEARASPVVHLDETGWRENGRNGYVWTMSTPTIRIFQYGPGRGGAVADRLLGEERSAVVVSDFYGAYDHLEGLQQRCWAHLLRDIAQLVTDAPEDHRLQRWAVTVSKLYHRAMDWSTQATAEQVRPICRERVRDRFEAALVAVCRGQPADAPHAGLCQRIERYRADLFTFVAEPGVPPTNNAAERALRPVVIARKISGGTRSRQGSRTRMILQSLVATWDVQGRDPVAEFMTLLAQPRPTPSGIAPV
jgi:hypothetical protein